MAYTYVLQVPVEFGLEFVAIIGANGIDPEREFSDDVINEVDRILLRMPFINLQGANTGGIIDCRVLEIPDLAAFLSLEIEEFHIDLHVVPRHLFLITNGRNRPFALPIRQAIQAVALQYVVYPTRRDLDAMITSQIPADSYLAKMISAPQVKDLFLDGERRAQLGILRAGFAVDKPLLSMRCKGSLPLVVGSS
jgi:hypothetical protein